MSPPPIASSAARVKKPRVDSSSACRVHGAMRRHRRPRLAMTNKLVIFSPHLDDAVLSLGATISREVAAGREVEVVSCFTSGPPLDAIQPEHRVFGDYSIRREEDKRALTRLGAKFRWLDLHERIWRKPPLPKARSVFPTHVF